jgi:hypothetical protein
MRRLARPFAALAAALSLGAVSACGSDNPPPDARPGDPTLAAIRAEIFDTTCGLSSCHAPPTVAAKLNLRDSGLCQQMVSRSSCLFSDRLLIVPGKPEASFLINKLRGTNLAGTPDPDCATSNERMPFGQVPLSEAKIAQIEQWIRDGASCGDEVPVDAGMPLDAGIDSGDDGLADVASFTAVTTTLKVGETTQATVTLTRGASTVGQILILDPEDVAILGVPNAIVLAYDETTKTFDVLGKQAAAITSLTASSGTNSMALTFTILPP